MCQFIVMHYHSLNASRLSEVAISFKFPARDIAGEALGKLSGPRSDNRGSTVPVRPWSRSRLRCRRPEPGEPQLRAGPNLLEIRAEENCRVGRGGLGSPMPKQDADLLEVLIG
jgi:hypothetical protein